jgi:hypothetical protein
LWVADVIILEDEAVVDLAEGGVGVKFVGDL